MGKITIKELQEQEHEILIKRENHKKEIRTLTNNLYNVRQKIRYMKKNRNRKPSSMLFEVFNKKRHELTVEEIKEYNKMMQKKRREKAEKNNKKLLKKQLTEIPI